MLALEPGTWAKVLAFGLFLLLAGVASSAHAALSGINRNRIKNLIEGGLSRAQAILRVLDEPTSVFATILVLGTVGTSGAIICAMLLAFEPTVTWPWASVVRTNPGPPRRSFGCWSSRWRTTRRSKRTSGR
jgi:CBS domain containing-hemolysin-like protein